MWNSFTMIGKNKELTSQILSVVEAAIVELKATEEDSKFYNDDYCLAMLLKAVCLRHLKQHTKAEACLLVILQ